VSAPTFLDATIVERLIDTLPEPRATYTICAAGTSGVKITLDGPEHPFLRAMACMFLAAEIGDEDGPESTTVGRYAVGTYEGIDVLVECPLTDADRRELLAFAKGQRMVDGFGIV
jgi:hypothetical protein